MGPDSGFLKLLGGSDAKPGWHCLLIRQMDKLRLREGPELDKDSVAGGSGIWDSNPGVKTPIPVLSALPFAGGSAMEEKLARSILGRKS